MSRRLVYHSLISFLNLSLAKSMSVSTSSLLLLKFSMLNAKTVTSRIPKSRHHCSVSVNLLNLKKGVDTNYFNYRRNTSKIFALSAHPFSCPSFFWTQFFFANRRFPSITIATCFGRVPRFKMLNPNLCNHMSDLFGIHSDSEGEDSVIVNFFSVRINSASFLFAKMKKTSTYLQGR